MAYKDEYEVARLFAAPEFRRQLEAQFDGKLRLAYHLAPPALGASKRRFGDWTGLAFKVLARLKFLRGTVLDPFGRTQERRMERDLIAEYRMRIEAVLGRLTPGTLDSAVSIARVPEKIRGFGHVKQSSVQEARSEWERLASTLASAL
jgi:indolepyruvate ferredoxin oxidoreductase